MIRIDEIYYNVFAAALQHRPLVGLHWFEPFGSVDFNHLCNVPPVYGVAEKRIVFWDQEPFYQTTAQKFLDQFVKTYEGPTTIVTSERSVAATQWVSDTYQINVDYYFFHGWAALDWYRGYHRTFLSRPWKDRTFSYRFLCPNNIVGGNRTHRLRLFAELCRRNLIVQNLISFPEICPYEKVSVRDLCQKLSIDIDVMQWLPLTIDQAKDHAPDSHRIDYWQPGCQAFVHVVTETVFDSDRLHLTEKTFKPIVMQQPFVLVAPKGSLEYLRSYGFRTFDHIWDESYDQADDHKRIDLIADLLADIHAWSPAKVQEAKHEIDAVIMHNHQWFYGGFEQVLWEELQDMIAQW